jgi:hypothetical protein
MCDFVSSMFWTSRVGMIYMCKSWAAAGIRYDGVVVGVMPNNPAATYTFNLPHTAGSLYDRLCTLPTLLRGKTS